MSSGIFVEYLKWYSWKVPGNILRAWKNILLFNLNYFSIGLLFVTFFSPWRRYTWQHSRGFDIADRLNVLASNLISRIIGAVMRSFVLCMGIIVEIFLVPAGLFVLVLWFALPIVIVLSLYYAFGILL